jgi:hypothetical protein
MLLTHTERQAVRELRILFARNRNKSNYLMIYDWASASITGILLRRMPTRLIPPWRVARLLWHRG